MDQAAQIEKLQSPIQELEGKIASGQTLAHIPDLNSQASTTGTTTPKAVTPLSLPSGFCVLEQ